MYFVISLTAFLAFGSCDAFVSVSFRFGFRWMSLRRQDYVSLLLLNHPNSNNQQNHFPKNSQNLHPLDNHQVAVYHPRSNILELFTRRFCDELGDGYRRCTP